MPCDKCYRYGRLPSPRCPEGKRIKQKVREARIAFDNGEGTYQEWVDAWDEWQDHYKPRRSKKKSKSKNKQTEL